ncbi:MAG: hypothetical protein KF703_06900 [Actinobacteria bacterium]|nr:hypothetical protein [Actinomycetota bacterium]
MASRPERIAPLHWDSAFFGLAIGRVAHPVAHAADAADLEAEGRERGFDCLYLDVEAAPDHPTVLLQDLGYRLVEVALDLVHPTNVLTTCPPTRSVVRWGGSGDAEDAGRQAEGAAPWSRFAVDPRFGPEAAVRVLHARVARAAAGEDGHRLLVAEDDHGVTGVATVVDADAPERRIDLIASDRPGSGAAQALVTFAFGRFGPGRSRGGPIAARNVASLRFSLAMGYQVAHTRYRYHRWLDEPPARAIGAVGR